MDLGLKSKVALVVGASEGMGKAAAGALAAEGCAVALVARSRSTLDVAAEELARFGNPVGSWAADFTEADAPARVVREVAERFGRIDILVNAVGAADARDSILDFDDDLWQFHVDSVLLSTVRACREVIPVMLAAGGGAIVNIAAQSSEHYFPRIAPYSAMKAAVAHLTKNLAKEFASRRIRVNAVRPGWILSESQRRRIDARKAPGMTDDEHFAELLEYWRDVSWSERFGTLEEVAAVVAFLASEQASYVNGALVAVDGGSY